MITFTERTLPNGLRFIHHYDGNTNLAVCNILYNVGARDEDPERTGFAHLFEHLMFGGSVNVPSFDTPLQKAGGENNAFTSNDITNYYITIPSENIETALWLESDRMLRLDFSERSLGVQKGVVTEEFRQRYLNQPYGDSWLKLRPLAYKIHPYRWPTIGAEIAHIEDARLEDVVAFFERFYNPSNAIICIAGNISLETAYALVEKWFGDIPAGPVNPNLYPSEPPIDSRREEILEADVPQNALYMAFQMVNRLNDDYHAYDMLSDMLSGSESSRFNNILVREKGIFTHIHAYVSGEIDKGLFIVEGRLQDDKTFEEAEHAVMDIFTELSDNTMNPAELEKVKNKAITANLFGKTSALNKAMGLCFASLLGDANLINTETDKLRSVTTNDIQRICRSTFVKGNPAILKYKSKK